MATRGCVNFPNCFCYICGSYTVKKQQRNISNFVQKVYFAYFGIKLGDQDKSWAPHVVCSVCVEELRHWFQVQGFNLKNRKDISYPTIIRSAIHPVPHEPDFPIPSPPDTLNKNILYDLDQIPHIGSDSDDGYDPGTNEPELFSQPDLNDLKNSLVNVALYHIHHIWHYRVRLRESGQPIGRLRKTCKNAFPRSIPVSFGRLDTPIATESSLNAHFLKFPR
ncbi:uncharacterized protein TNCV_572191 [Trichonephila clavipes]|nr:uncharacterized protein TNCV_572191 [Trichonephila clavipes]